MNPTNKALAERVAAFIETETAACKPEKTSPTLDRLLHLQHHLQHHHVLLQPHVLNDLTEFHFMLANMERDPTRAFLVSKKGYDVGHMMALMWQIHGPKRVSITGLVYAQLIANLVNPRGATAVFADPGTMENMHVAYGKNAPSMLMYCDPVFAAKMVQWDINVRSLWLVHVYADQYIALDAKQPAIKTAAEWAHSFRSLVFSQCILKNKTLTETERAELNLFIMHTPIKHIQQVAPSTNNPETFHEEFAVLGTHCICITCNKLADKACNQCKAACYCSAECQKSDWRVHKQECKTFEKFEVVCLKILEMIEPKTAVIPTPVKKDTTTTK